MSSVVEISAGLWECRVPHPEWDADDNDGWGPEVAWWVVSTDAGLLAIDPLITDGWDWLDDQVQRAGGCVGVLRTIRFHERSVVATAARYGVEFSARPMPADEPADEIPQDCTKPKLIAGDGEPLAGGAAITHWVSNGDELAVWLPGPKAFIFGDAMIRDQSGRLQRAPDAWLSPRRGAEQLAAELLELTAAEPLHLLVAHGPLVTADGPQAMRAALA